MSAILVTLWLFVVDLFKSKSRLQTENLFLRHQLNIALRRAPSRIRLSGSDRALIVLITNLWPNLGGMARLVQPETILRWIPLRIHNTACWGSPFLATSFIPSQGCHDRYWPKADTMVGDNRGSFRG